MCGIFGYLNYNTQVDSSEVVQRLLTGLRRLEYRGYDSAGVAFDTTRHEDDDEDLVVVVKECGNIDRLSARVERTMRERGEEIDFKAVKQTGHCAIAHTRWATHGVPSEVNSHPQLARSQSSGLVEWCVVHNGIITNYRPLKDFLSSRGLLFESDTDTEVIPKLCKYVWDGYDDAQRGEVSFREVVSQVVGELEGAFALLFKSTHFPGELVGCKRGSPLLLGIRQRGGGDDDGASPGAAEVHEGNGVCLSPRGGVGAGGRDHSEHHGGGACEFYFSSDASAIVEHTKRVVVMEDGDVVHVSGGGYSVYAAPQQRQHGLGGAPFGAHHKISRQLETLEIGVEQIMKGGYDHFMPKEIHEQPSALVETMRGRIALEVEDCSEGDGSECTLERQGSLKLLDSLDLLKEDGGGAEPLWRGATPRVKLGGLEPHAENILRSRRLIFVACGTSYHACLAARQVVEELTRVPVALELASDLLDRQAPLYRDDTCFFVSQSGETADTLNALQYAKRRGSLCVGITNTVGSSISRETACGVHVNAGVEIGVASTKAYTCQILVIVMIALKLSEDSISKGKRRNEIMRDLLRLPSMMRRVLREEGVIKDLARELAQETSLLAFGRGYNYATALELALKVKELSYMHSEGILAGELKHGPLALIDETMPAVVVATNDALREKMWSTIQQLLARKGRLVLLVSKGDDDILNYFSGEENDGRARIITVDTVCDCLQPILNIVPFQLLSYHLTVLRGFNVDQPRNLAKSVTVE